MILQTGRRYGWSAAATLASDRLGKRLWNRQVTELVALDLKNVPDALLDCGDWNARFLNADELARAAEDPTNDLDAETIHRLDRGDRCFGIFDGNRIAAYGWYALNSIEPEHCFGFGMSFPKDAAYMYKGFTHRDYRGKRLHALGMGLAVEALSKTDGVTWLVSTVDWTNAASLKSCQRIGYERLGRVISWDANGEQKFQHPLPGREREIMIFDRIGDVVDQY